jgi:thiol-disulfide isomerase/thioredoxin
MRQRFLLATAAVALALGALAAGFFLSWQWLRGPRLESGPAPAIILVDLSGTAHDLQQPAGKLRLVNFWAPWCAPCIEEIPLLVEAQTRYGDRGLQILGPALDEPDAVRAMVQRLHINYPVSADMELAVRASDALGDSRGVLPYSVLISRDGRILRTFEGSLDREALGRLIEKHL